MSVLPALAALLLFAAFVLLSADRAARSIVVGRVLQLVAFVALLPSLFEGGAVPLGATAASLLTASPLAGLVASALAAVAAIGAGGTRGGAGIAAGVAVGLCAVALTRSFEERSAKRGSWVETGALTTLASTILVGTVDGGRALGWTVALGDVVSRAELPGLGVLLGTQLLVGLAGGLVLAAAASGDDLVRESLSVRFGRRGLILAASLGLLSLGVLAREVIRAREDVLGASGPTMLALVLAAGLLLLGSLASLTGESQSRLFAEGSAGGRWVHPATLMACLVATLLAGRSAILAEGSFMTPETAGMGAATLLSLASVLGARSMVLWMLTLSALLLTIV